MIARRMGYAFVTMLFMPFDVQAQRTVAAPAGIAHIAVRASDVEREVSFLAKLGFEEAFANTANGQTTQAFVKVNDRQFIEVYPQSAAGEAPRPLGMMHVCYEAADLRVLFDGYTASGLNPSSWRKAGAGNLLFNLADPDGRVTEFTQYMPGSRQMNDVGQHLGKARVAGKIIGFEMPVGDEKSALQFYESMGFARLIDGKNLTFGLAGNPQVRIVFLTGQKNARPELLFSTDDARAAANQLLANGLKHKQNGNKLVVRDPDGNAFVIIEPGKKRAPSVIH